MKYEEKFKYGNIVFAVLGSMLLMTRLNEFIGMIFFNLSSVCGIIYFRKDKSLCLMNMYFQKINLIGLMKFY